MQAEHVRRDNHRLQTAFWGAGLAAELAQVDALGVQAKVKFALLTGLTLDKAQKAVDTPDLLAKADDALAQIKALFG